MEVPKSADTEPACWIEVELERTMVLVQGLDHQISQFMESDLIP